MSDLSAPSLSPLTIAIATTVARLGHLRLPPPWPGLDYLVTCQGTGAEILCSGSVSSGLAGRADVTLLPVPGLGLSRNRNAGLAAAKGELVLFCDDDIALDPEGVQALARALGAARELDFVLGWRAEAFARAGRPSATRLATRGNTGRVCVPEILCRRAAVLRAGVRFDEDFGVGAPHPVGEDYIFVTDLLRAGLRGRHLPIVTGAHPHPSTGDRWDDPALLVARRAVLGRVFGRKAPLARLVYGLRHRHRLGGLGAGLAFALGR